MTDPKDEELDSMLENLPNSDADGPHPDDGLLAAYARGRASAEDHERIESHLVSCSDCRFLVSQLAEPVSDELLRRASETFVPRRSRKASYWIGGMAVAFAASVLVLMVPSADAPLPTYDRLGPFGGVVETRGEEAPSARFAAGGTLRIVLRPDQAYEGVLNASAWLKEPESWRRLPSELVTVSDNGAVQLEVPVASIGVEPGTHRLALWTSTERSDAERLDEAAVESLPDTQWHSFEFVLIGESDE